MTGMNGKRITFWFDDELRLCISDERYREQVVEFLEQYSKKEDKK